MFRHQRAALPLWLAAFLFLPAAALPASFFVSPVRVDLSVRKTTAAMTVRNDSEKPVVIQLHATAWTQAGGQDSTTPTTDLIATPPLFTLQPQGAQIVRLGLRKPDTLATTEQTFRVFLQEVPPPPKPGDQGVTMALRLSIPVFVAPASPKGPALLWRADMQPDGDINLRVENTGDTHSQITQLRLFADKADKPVVGLDVVNYVLAGQSREWKLKPESGPASTNRRFHLVAETDAGRADTELELPAR
jgi:fimbrial chaperone protein